MKKRQESLSLLRGAVGTYRLCRCYFSYDPEYWYFYLFGISDQLMLGVEEDDFLLDGFQIRRLADLRRVEIKDDLCVRINEENGLLCGVERPAIDLSSWKSVFESFPHDLMLIVQNESAGRRGFFISGISHGLTRPILFFLLLMLTEGGRMAFISFMMRLRALRLATDIPQHGKNISVCIRVQGRTEVF